MKNVLVTLVVTAWIVITLLVVGLRWTVENSSVDSNRDEFNANS